LTIIDINPCANASCHHICLLRPNQQYTCSCNKGYTLFPNGTCFLDSESEELDEKDYERSICEERCYGGATCMNLENTWKCVCNLGYNGPQCQLSAESLQSSASSFFGWLFGTVICCIIFVVILILVATLRKGPFDMPGIRKQLSDLKSTPNSFRESSLSFVRCQQRRERRSIA